MDAVIVPIHHNLLRMVVVVVVVMSRWFPVYMDMLIIPFYHDSVVVMGHGVTTYANVVVVPLHHDCARVAVVVVVVDMDMVVGTFDEDVAWFETWIAHLIGRRD